MTQFCISPFCIAEVYELNNGTCCSSEEKTLDICTKCLCFALTAKSSLNSNLQLRTYYKTYILCVIISFSLNGKSYFIFLNLLCKNLQLIYVPSWFLFHLLLALLHHFLRTWCFAMNSINHLLSASQYCHITRMEKTFRYMIINKKNNNGNSHTRHPAVHNMTSQISPSAVYRKFTSIQSRGDNIQATRWQKSKENWVHVFYH